MKYRTRVVTLILCFGIIFALTYSSSIHPLVAFADQPTPYYAEAQHKQRTSAKPSIVTLVAGVTHPDHVAVDKTHVYFVNNAKKLDVRFKSGGSPTTLFETSGADEIKAVATDDTGVYVLTSNKLVKVDPETHDSSELAQIESNDRQLVLDETSVYWIGRIPGGKGNQLIKIDKKGGGLTTLATEIFAPQPGGLAVDQTTAYWLDYAVDTLKSVKKESESAVTTLLKFTGPQAVAVDDRYVYYSAVDGSIKKLDKKGGPAQTIVSEQTGSVFIIVDDGDQLYYSGSTQIMKVSKNGGRPVIVVRKPAGSYRFAVDDCCVYWTDYEAGRLMKGPK